MTRVRFGVWLSVWLMVVMSRVACAHDTPIALLELRETQPGTFIEAWTYSSAVNLDAPTAVYPSACAHEPPRVDCGSDGLRGSLTVERLGERYSAAVVRITSRDGAIQTFTLTAAQPVANLAAGEALPWHAVAASYVPLGFEHILLGIDHLMFVLCLMLLVRGTWMLIKTITAFTVAHSITLAAATFGWLGVPERAVNACIALSIAFVAAEVIQQHRGHHGVSARYPWAVAFAFGLLHGFGFANALTSIGLPAASLPAALLFFNVGVELGQLAFVGIALALWQAHRVLEARGPAWSTTVAMYAMGTIAMVWFLSRFGQIAQPLLAS